MIVAANYEGPSATISINPLCVDSTYKCAGSGLIYLGYVRNTLDEIDRFITERRTYRAEKAQKKKTSKKYEELRTKDWLRAQCRFLDLPCRKNLTEEDLEDALSSRIKSKKGASLQLLELEIQANQRFCAGVAALVEFANTTDFDPLPPRPAKRKRNAALPKVTTDSSPSIHRGINQFRSSEYLHSK
ncbi:hypothetical protein FRC07_011149 [Ceratobasidium sp. 392]|nr:hypothetical protein FRC07_011149 [Ceratobasidium sp. 392]